MKVLVLKKKVEGPEKVKKPDSTLKGLLHNVMDCTLKGHAAKNVFAVIEPLN